MSADANDVKAVAEELKGRFEEFKNANNKRIEAVEQEKSKLAETVENLNGKLTELDEQKSALEEEIKKLNRPDKASDGLTKEQMAHKEAFTAFLRKGKDDNLAELEQKALNTGADSEGGFAVPEQLDRQLIKLQRDAVVMRQACNVVTVGTSDYKKIVSTGKADSGWVAEKDERPGTGTPGLAQIAASMGEIYGNPAATQKMLDDSFFNAESWLNDELAMEFAEAEEAAFTKGDGADKPKGLLAYSTDANSDKTRAFGTLQHLASGNASEIIADSLVNLVYTLRKVYRSSARWMMNNDALFKVRILKDNEGNYLWRPGIEQGQPSQLLGYGIYENEQMPDVAADSLPVGFGDFKRAYTIVDRIGTRILRDPFTNKPYVHFYTTKRVGGMLTNSQAVKLLKISA